MPDKTSVSVDFRIRRPGEADDLHSASGQLHRMVTGWALTCRFTGAAEESDMTLVVRNTEIRMNRRGALTQEQLFMVGEWKPGTVGTPYGTMNAEALTHRIEQELTLSGGFVEWSYDYKMMDQTLERCSIKLEIREERMS